MNYLRFIPSAFRVVKNKLIFIMLRSKRNSIRILNAEATVQAIIDEKLSVCRYGDGELNMVFNYIYGYEDSRKSGFQIYNENLGARLLEILEGKNKMDSKCLICLPGCMFRIGTGYLRDYAARFWEGYTVNYLSKLLGIINKNQLFGETNFSRFYLSHKDKTNSLSFLRHVQKIWNNRDIVIVEGCKTMLGIGNDLFSNAKSIKRILCPSKDAWSKYDEILACVGNEIPLPPPE